MDPFLTHLADKRAKLQKQRRKIESDLADLDKAERLYRESGAGDAFEPIPRDFAEADLIGPTPGQPQMIAPAEGTIKQRVVAILDVNPAGLTSGQILNVLRLNLPNLARASLSPQLSRLKKDNEINLDPTTSLWKRVKKHETQGG